MERAWYHKAKECTSLRKHVLRADMCIFIDDETAFANLNFLSSTIKSILTSAIINGLDIVGILSPDAPYVDVSLSPQNSIDYDIINQLGYWNIDEYIGDPKEAASPEYKVLANFFKSII